MSNKRIYGLRHTQLLATGALFFHFWGTLSKSMGYATPILLQQTQFDNLLVTLFLLSMSSATPIFLPQAHFTVVLVVPSIVSAPATFWPPIFPAFAPQGAQRALSLFFFQNMKQTLTELRSENYDLIIDLHSNIRSFWLKFRLRINSFTVCKRNWRKFFKQRE